MKQSNVKRKKDITIKDCYKKILEYGEKIRNYRGYTEYIVREKADGTKKLLKEILYELSIINNEIEQLNSNIYSEKERIKKIEDCIKSMRT